MPKVKAAVETDVDRSLALIPELANLTGLTDKMRNDFNVMKDVGSFTRLLPAQRQESLQKFLTNVNNSPEAKEVLKAWGLELESATADVPARVMNPETLYFGRGERVIKSKNSNSSPFFIRPKRGRQRECRLGTRLHFQADADPNECREMGVSNEFISAKKKFCIIFLFSL